MALTQAQQQFTCMPCYEKLSDSGKNGMAGVAGWLFLPGLCRLMCDSGVSVTGRLVITVLPAGK